MGYTNNTHLAIDRDTRWDQKISFYIVFYYFAEIANATIKTVLPISGSVWRLLSIAWGGLIVFFMLRCIREVVKRKRAVFWWSMLIFAGIYLVSYIQIISRGEPTQAFWSGTVLMSFAYWIPIGVAAASIKNKKILYDTFYRWSYAMSILLFMCLFFRQSTVLMEGETEYNMFFGFHIVIPALFQITEYYHTKKSFILAFFVFEVLLIIAYANRGALIPIIFYFLFTLVFSGDRGSRERIVNFIVISLLAGVILIFSNSFFSLLVDFSNAVGLNSRTLAMLESGEIRNPTGRDELSAIAWRMIGEKPILGWGLGGEYYRIAVELGQATPGVTKAAFTPHNGFLEFLISFGVVGGSIVTLLFLLPILRQKAVKDHYAAALILIFGAAIIAPCMISADGILIKPGAAIYLYLYLTRNS